MAKLPPDGEWLVQQIETVAGAVVIVVNQYTDQEIVRFDPADADACARAQQVIHDSPLLSDEQKSFAHFWSGYFYAYAVMRL